LFAGQGGVAQGFEEAMGEVAGGAEAAGKAGGQEAGVYC